MTKADRVKNILRGIAIVLLAFIVVAFRYTRQQRDILRQEELDRAVADKNWEQAVRMTYILTLRHLHEAGRIQWLPNKTPMEYVRAVGMMPFLHLTNAFLRVRFGQYPATEQDWQDADSWRKLTEKGGVA